MESYIARQPIFNGDLKVVAYELLFRGGHTEWNGDIMSEDVVFNAFHLSLNKNESSKYFVNFTKKNILSDLPRVFKSDCLVVEILENVIPDEELLRKCHELKRAGYLLALDDFQLNQPTEILADLVDVIKVDFQDTTLDERKIIIDRYRSKNKILLAEKVETKKEFLEALTCGFELFQGFFFAKPEEMKAKNISSIKYEYLEILFELMLKEPSLKKIEKLIKRNYALTIRLFKIVNSPLFYSKRRVTSIMDTIVLLGLTELRRLVSLLILKSNDSKKSNEVIKYSLFRACFLESIVEESTLHSFASECFILGLLSFSDVVFDMELEKVISFFPVSENVENALLKNSGLLIDVYKFMLDYENGELEKVNIIANRLDINLNHVSKCYIEVMNKIDRYFESEL